MKNKIIWVNTLIILLLSASLLYLVFNTKYRATEIPQTKNQISDEYYKQSELSMEISQLLFEFKRAAYPLDEKKPDIAKVKAIQKRLNNALEKTTTNFGLKTKRFVDLFNVWQVNDLPKVLNPKKYSSTNDFDFEAFRIGLSDQIRKAENDYKQVNFNKLLLSGFSETYKPNSKIYQEIWETYEGKAKQLIPQAKTELVAKVKESGTTGCLGPSLNDLTAKSIAENVAWHQYQSRYCPFLTQNKATELCAKLVRDYPAFDKEARLRFEKGIAFCRIAKMRIDEEAKLAQEKYGKLSFEQYYDQFVKSLVPKYINKLKASKGEYKTCSTEHLPVVPFREPETDAQIAAYEIAGPKLCEGFFDQMGEKGQFGSLRETAYKSTRS